MNDTTIDLQINTDRLERFCEKLISKSRSTSRAHDSLVMLEAFITQFTQHSQGSAEFRSVISTLRKHSDNTRKQLLAENAIQLDSSLRNMDIIRITQVHLPLCGQVLHQINLVFAGADLDGWEATPAWIAGLGEHLSGSFHVERDFSAREGARHARRHESAERRETVGPGYFDQGFLVCSQRERMVDARV